MTCSKSFCALPYIKSLEEYLDIHYILFFSSHSLLDHFQSLSIPIMNRGHYFSIFVLFNLLTELDTINSPLLIETHSASRMLLFSYSPNSLLKPQSHLLVSPQTSDPYSGFCLKFFGYLIQSCGSKYSMLVTTRVISPAQIFFPEFQLRMYKCHTTSPLGFLICFSNLTSP